MKPRNVHEEKPFEKAILIVASPQRNRFGFKSWKHHVERQHSLCATRRCIKNAFRVSLVVEFMTNNKFCMSDMKTAFHYWCIGRSGLSGTIQSANVDDESPLEHQPDDAILLSFIYICARCPSAPFICWCIQLQLNSIFIRAAQMGYISLQSRFIFLALFAFFFCGRGENLWLRERSMVDGQPQEHADKFICDLVSIECDISEDKQLKQMQSHELNFLRRFFMPFRNPAFGILFLKWNRLHRIETLNRVLFCRLLVNAIH